MDSLTQIVLGAAVGEATLGKKVGNKALLYGAIAGTIPDLDVLAHHVTDTITATELHRGFSHSIVFCVLMAPILGWTVNRLERSHNLGWYPWASLFFWGLFTHPLLDAFTTWGTQLFWPFDIRLAFNSIFVIDPFYTLPFLCCVITVLFLKRASNRRKVVNRFGLIWSTTYLVLTLIVKELINHRFANALETQGIEFVQFSSRPAPLSIFLWNVNVDTETDYLIGDYSVFDTEPILFKSYAKNREDSAVLEHNTNVQRLIQIAEGWYILEERNGGWYFNDLRFGLIPSKNASPYFAFSYRLIEENGVLLAEERQKTSRDARFLLQKLWQRIKGNR